MTSIPPSSTSRTATIAPPPPSPGPTAPEPQTKKEETHRLATMPKKKSGGGVLRTLIQLMLVAGICVGIYFCYGPISAMIKNLQGGSESNGHGKKDMPLPVVVAKARMGPISIYDDGLGSVTPLNSVTIKTRVNGQLMSLPFQEGQIVKTGDPIAEIDPRPYQVTLEQAQAQLLHDQAVLDNAKTDLERYETLWKQNSVSQQILATQQATVTQDQGTVGTDQASIDSAKLNLVYCHITSPIDGQVGLRQVDIGNYVQSSDANGIVVINQIEPITVLFTVSEDSITPILQSLQRGEHLAVTALDRSQANVLAQGSLLTTDNQIDPTTGTLRLRAQFDNKDHSLFPNQFVNAKVLIKTKPSVLLIPNAAIQTGQNGPFVYTVLPDNTVATKPVTTGTSDAKDIEITKGLEEGDSVIIDGVDKLQEGSKVVPTAPAAASDSPGATPSPTGTHHHHRHAQDGSTPDSSGSPTPASPSAPGSPAPAPAPSNNN